MSRHFEKCGRYAGPLKTSHFLFDLDRFQEIQLLTRNLSKAQTQQYLAEHLKTAVAPMSSLHYFSSKKIMKATSFPETNSFNNSSEKCRLKNCHAFFSNPFFFLFLYLPLANSPASREHQMFFLSSFFCILQYCGSPHKTRCSRGTNKSLAPQRLHPRCCSSSGQRSTASLCCEAVQPS